MTTIKKKRVTKSKKAAKVVRYEKILEQSYDLVLDQINRMVPASGQVQFSNQLLTLIDMEMKIADRLSK